MNSTFSTSLPVAGSTKGWNILLWVLQVGLAGMFAMSGVMKVTTPAEQLVTMMPWAADLVWLIRFIGISELLGAVGLILPSLLRVRPSLTVVSAWALALVMLLAIGFHIARAEFAAIGVNILLGGVAAVVALGRSFRSPIEARS